MRHILTVTALALLIALPASAQTPAQTASLPGSANPLAAQATDNPYPNNGYADEAASLIAREEALPAGGDERVAYDLQWRELVAKANADRVGTPINLAKIRTYVEHNRDS